MTVTTLGTWLLTGKQLELCVVETSELIPRGELMTVGIDSEEIVMVND
jgi:hypothetical protein